MSSLIVEITEIEKVLPHPNADNLEIATVKGWQIIVRKGMYQESDRVVYVPIDSILPLELSDRLEVTQYLSNQRVRCARLRGEPSFGLTIKPEQDWEIGTDLASHYGIVKYEPPIRAKAGDAMEDHQLFEKYTEIENMRNFPDVFLPGEEVLVSEKIHGTCCRIGLIEGEWMAGSKEIRRRRPENDDFASNLYWYPLSLEPVRNLLEALSKTHKQVVLYGEVFGPKVQSLAYGVKNGLGFRAFDLLIDRNYVNWADFYHLCEKYGVQAVPWLADISFDLQEIKKMSDGKTTVMKDNPHMREGVVVRPAKERRDSKLGRVILKYVGDDYLFGKKSDFKDE